MVAKGSMSMEFLSIAIRSEIDAQNTYRELAQRVSTPNAKERFYLLVTEERQHQDLLERKYKELFPNQALHIPPSLLPPTVSKTALRKKLDLLEVLSLAIQAERESRKLYLDAAAAVGDPNGRAMLTFLADWEYSHQKMLTAEREMLKKYPTCYDEGEPWKKGTHPRKGRR